jgi:hypothetical protein
LGYRRRLGFGLSVLMDTKIDLDDDIKNQIPLYLYSEMTPWIEPNTKIGKIHLSGCGGMIRNWLWRGKQTAKLGYEPI